MSQEISLLPVAQLAHLAQPLPRLREAVLQLQDLDLLLHLAHLELVPAELGIVDDLVLVGVAPRDNVLYLPNEAPARRRHGLARRLEVLLRLAHQRRLDARRGNELRRAGSDVVGRHDELLGRVAPADDAVGRLDKHVGRVGDRLGGGDEAFGPAVVLLVEGRTRHGAAPPLFDNLLLRGRSGLDELRNGISYRNGGFENRAVENEIST